MSLQPATKDGNPVTQLQCKKCRVRLATMDQVEQHTPGVGQAAFSYFKRTRGLAGGKPAPIDSCNTFFLNQEAVALWGGAAPEASVLEGRLDCPKCNTKLGLFHLAGTQCSCGAWIAPAYCIQKARVDLSVVLKSD
ncbi:hypothetical protein BASA50_003141 [Batrachochytrium salamandrivorans]|uniref:protein-tyrosine-phosphatase n=1 Tax=Batrachochytrium salamandrivorans TaxID=1357716 RepID=A0ABQ8FJJ3_9FUNG|nr:hypothetical protein BASA60_011122 [Batrachochytrium salamandrivorans]KAH6564126.1 hypothetical protein BASA62_008061 [Batrachochytrium salamandrivorans]KAH6581112.1 hypothetical protein BASA61_009235 [Batrachochytrium salamandrivorans]KAH6599255.1 hypothetical protein BASA50_003141 [Batrachochytrium salamandrivorans]KAH9253088.1 hypothetical protein BASA81_008995 [Batrachochytrium salamandrivorans]